MVVLLLSLSQLLVPLAVLVVLTPIGWVGKHLSVAPPACIERQVAPQYPQLFPGVPDDPPRCGPGERR